MLILSVRKTCGAYEFERAQKLRLGSWLGAQDQPESQQKCFAGLLRVGNDCKRP